MRTTLLRVDDLCVTFPGAGEPVPAVRNVSFALAEGERIALVGESGCGKSVIAQAVMRLLPPETAISGSVRLNGIDIFAQSETAMEKIRGVQMGMVFQSPERALNPVYRIGKQLTDPLVIHGICDRTEAKKRVRDVLGSLGFTDPEWMMKAYPWMCSGGMCQRVLFAA
ncbi:MAG TPA: ATP-binding cassette domain-containing protein, partial [Methanoculleus sp.]|nr:ATP-binding cassette domain-containing protein [Methanoculleus sp.]